MKAHSKLDLHDNLTLLFVFSEFVKSHNNIYYYNCDRKNEFIKKGMGKWVTFETVFFFKV